MLVPVCNGKKMEGGCSRGNQWALSDAGTVLGCRRETVQPWVAGTSSQEGKDLPFLKRGSAQLDKLGGICDGGEDFFLMGKGTSSFVEQGVSTLVWGKSVDLRGGTGGHLRTWQGRPSGRRRSEGNGQEGR